MRVASGVLYVVYELIQRNGEMSKDDLVFGTMLRPDEVQDALAALLRRRLIGMDVTTGKWFATPREKGA